MKRNRTPSILSVSSIVSRVVPAMSDTRARSSPSRRFRRVLLPTLGSPTITTAFFDGVAESERVRQACDFSFDAVHHLPQACTVGELNVFFRKVEFEFEEGGQLQQFVAQRTQCRRISAPHLGRGHGVRSPGIGSDQIGDGFGLREVHPACEEGPNGKFARLRHTSAGAKQECDDFGDDVVRTVTR